MIERGSTEVPPLNPDATCPKCGCDDVTMHHYDAARFFDCRESECYMADTNRKEHMHRRCIRCGFTWPESVLA